MAHPIFAGVQAADLSRYPESLAGNYPELAVKFNFPFVLSTIFGKAVPRLIISSGIRKNSEEGLCRRNGMLKIKRIYDTQDKDDGFRVLVDRLWPRGISKERAHLDLWLKEIAPSDALRKWFAHDPKRWTEFQKKYREELTRKMELAVQIKKLEAENGNITLLYSAHDPLHNQAVALLRFLKGARSQ
jgi:uncharacterized protein YeaO (DUF488 family)